MDKTILVARVLARQGPDVELDIDLMEVAYRSSDRRTTRDGAAEILLADPVWVDRSTGCRVASTPKPFTSDLTAAMDFLDFVAPGSFFVLGRGRRKKGEPLHGIDVLFGDEPIASAEHDDRHRCILAAALRAAMELERISIRPRHGDESIG